MAASMPGAPVGRVSARISSRKAISTASQDIVASPSASDDGYSSIPQPSARCVAQTPALSRAVSAPLSGTHVGDSPTLVEPTRTADETRTYMPHDTAAAYLSSASAPPTAQLNAQSAENNPSATPLLPPRESGARTTFTENENFFILGALDQFGMEYAAYGRTGRPSLPYAIAELQKSHTFASYPTLAKLKNKQLEDHVKHLKQKYHVSFFRTAGYR
jgi:hypothetical protein